MNGKEIDDEKALIYDNNGEDYDENNVFEENTLAITLHNIITLVRNWQKEQKSDPHLIAANPTTQPPYGVHLSS